MKKLLSFVLALSCVFVITVIPVAAAEVPVERTGTVEYDLAELLGSDSIAPYASSSSTKTCPKISASKSGTGTVSAMGTPFTISAPANAKVTNVQVYQPSQSGTTSSTYTSVDTFNILHDGNPANISYRVISKPSTLYPCKTSDLNGTLVTGNWQIGATGSVLSNLSGFDGFTINGAKLIVTYTY